MKAGTEKRFSLGLCVVALAFALMGTSASTAGATAPANPIPFTKGTPLLISGGEDGYWADVPNSYDETHNTPTTLLVWLHGCGGFSSGDIYNVSPGGSQDWISVAPLGREEGCWNVGTDQSKVLAAVADVETHFNINPRRVILGGYSSGGDLAYRTAFYHANLFAGVLAVNTTPFRDTGSSQADSIAAASWKFHVVHLAHIQDTTYPIDVVESETDAMISAGFPLARIEREGTHYDAAGVVPGTTADIQTYLLPHIDDGWLSPAVIPNPDPDPDPDPDPGPATTPKVSIKTGPGKKTSSRKATFRFKSSVAGSTFKCRIDGKKFSNCTSPKHYRALRKGHHTFRVEAIADGKTSPVARYSWRVSKS